MLLCRACYGAADCAPGRRVLPCEFVDVRLSEVAVQRSSKRPINDRPQVHNLRHTFILPFDGSAGHDEQAASVRKKI
jgi:hypothetical protein